MGSSKKAKTTKLSWRALPKKRKALRNESIHHTRTYLGGDGRGGGAAADLAAEGGGGRGGGGPGDVHSDSLQEGASQYDKVRKQKQPVSHFTLLLIFCLSIIDRLSTKSTQIAGRGSGASSVCVARDITCEMPTCIFSLLGVWRGRGVNLFRCEARRLKRFSLPLTLGKLQVCPVSTRWILVKSLT